MPQYAIVNSCRTGYPKDREVEHNRLLQETRINMRSECFQEIEIPQENMHI